MSATHNMILAGFGGQGVLFAGKMIAYAGMVRFKAGATADLGVSVRPRWPLAELPAA